WDSTSPSFNSHPKKSIRHWKAEGLIRGSQPNRDHLGLYAFFSVTRAGHRCIRTDGHIHGDGNAVSYRFRVHDPVASHRPVIPVRSPVGQEIIHGVAGRGLPKRISLGRIAGSERGKEFTGRFLLGEVAEAKPKRDDQNQRNGGERNRQCMMLFGYFSRWFK